MRKLVTLRKISAINPIPNADAIEVVTVDGWQCVVKKGEFSLGQMVVYFEIDSILPKGRPEFEFLMARSCKMQPAEDGSLLEGHRLRTIKLRGQVSQGLVIPLGEDDQLLYDAKNDIHTVLFSRIDPDVAMDCDECGCYTTYYDNRGMDDDLSDIYGVKKWEKPIPSQLAGMCRGNYPEWLPKTDQERVQNLRHLPAGPYIYEEKMEGSSMTIYHDGEKVGVTSRNLDLLLEQEGNTFVDVAKASGIMDMLERCQLAYFDEARTTPLRIAVRGELIGPNVQGNIYNLPHHIFHVFDVYINDRYLTPEERTDFIFDWFNDINYDIVQAAQFLGRINPDEMSVGEIVELANGKSEFYDGPREGLVFKSLMIDRFGRVPSFKAISPEYLLKEAA
jgi:RNA ligase (TIGR02306 family)